MPYCTALAMEQVRPWTEMLVRSLGNDQDLFGFIMVGAYQDSRPGPGREKRIDFGWKDFLVFSLYLALAFPLHQLFYSVFGAWAWPDWSWMEKDRVPENAWDWKFMRANDYGSGHRWYLLMVLQVRLYLFVCERLNDQLRCMPPWLQLVLISIPCCLPHSIFSVDQGVEHAWNFCEAGSGASGSVKYVMSWVFGNSGSSCAMFWRWVHWYVVFYVLCYHYLRPAVTWISPKLPTGRTWAAVALGASSTLGVLMAMFHYPNSVLEDGTGVEWAWLELGVNFVQPSLLILGMTRVPLNMRWWGSTTLGCYAFHFYFKDHMTKTIQAVVQSLVWDPTGLLTFVVVVGMCLSYMTVVGPASHYLIISPLVAKRAVESMLQRSKRG
jgi:hypothetical protein